ncbi:MAG: 2-hydroxyacyl-CoA dehydratase family protein [Desulfosalsimonadaceae bacterium]
MNPENTDALEKKLQEFRDLHHHRRDIILHWKKETKGPVLGVLCSYAPRDILWAYGILPVRIHRLPGEAFSASFAGQYLPSFVCPFARNALDGALSGAYDALDGLIFSYTCDAACGLFNIWSRLVPGDLFWQVSQPYATGDGAETFLLAEYVRLCGKLEHHLGVKTDPDRLKRSLTLFQEIRQTVETFYEMRRKNPLLISGTDFYSVLYSGFFLPPPEFLRRLTELLELCAARPKREWGHKTPLFLSGTILEDLLLLDLIENAGGVVVDDDICGGRRCFLSDNPAGPFFRETDAPQDISSLLAEIVKGVGCRNACPSRGIPHDRFARVLSSYKASKSKGIVAIAPKFCDPALADYPLMQDYFKEQGIPLIFLEMEEAPGSGGQWKTRMEAFLEMIG